MLYTLNVYRKLRIGVWFMFQEQIEFCRFNLIVKSANLDQILFAELEGKGFRYINLVSWL